MTLGVHCRQRGVVCLPTAAWLRRGNSGPVQTHLHTLHHAASARQHSSGTGLYSSQHCCYRRRGEGTRSSAAPWKTPDKLTFNRAHPPQCRSEATSIKRWLVAKWLALLRHSFLIGVPPTSKERNFRHYEFFCHCLLIRTRAGTDSWMIPVGKV